MVKTRKKTIYKNELSLSTLITISLIISENQIYYESYNKKWGLRKHNLVSNALRIKKSGSTLITIGHCFKT